MGNTVAYKKIKIWRKDFVKDDGSELHFYSISNSSQMQDGSWINAYLPLYFTKNANAPERISNGAIADLDGFMSARKGKDGKGENVLVVTKVSFEDETLAEVDSFTAAEEDIPF